MAKRPPSMGDEPAPAPRRRLTLEPTGPIRPPQPISPAPRSRQAEVWEDLERRYQVQRPVWQHEHERIHALAEQGTDVVAILYDVANQLSRPVFHQANSAELPETVQLGYGEIRLDSARALFAALHMQPGQSFLDIGSGFGKLTMHALLEHGLAAQGVEYDASRVATSRQIQAAVVQRLGERAPAELARLDLFEQGDITTWRHQLNYDVIFFYNYLSGDALITALDAILARSSFQWYVDAQPPERHDSHVLQLDQTLVLTNDGGEEHTLYVYEKKASVAIRRRGRRPFAACCTLGQPTHVSLTEWKTYCDTCL